MNQFLLTRKFRVGQIIRASFPIADPKGGEIYLNAGEQATIMVCDPEKYPSNPYGLRKADEHITRVYVDEAAIVADPDHPRKYRVWEDNPAERYDHPDNPRHEELRAQGWKIDPATL
jgi:hypothetical protein